MKVFAAICCTLPLVCTATMSATAPKPGAEGVAALQAAAAASWDDFMALTPSVPTPWMPSSWHVENVAPAGKRLDETAAVALGRMLAQRLAEIAPLLQTLPPGDELLGKTTAMCDLADWSTTDTGYGNMLLAQRARDLAAVGVARLAADLEFPLERILPLAVRLHPLGPGPAERQRALNGEAGVDIFRMADQSDLEATWAAGARLLAQSRQADPRRGGAPRSEMDLLRTHLDFFADEPPGPNEPVTLVAMWERKWHRRLVDGLESRSAAQAVAIVEYRRVTGRFPLQLLAAERAPESGIGSAMSAARGFPLVLPVPSTPLGQRAFEQAWQVAAGSANGSRSVPTGRQAHVASLAWTAYEAVQQGVFLDHDTASERYRK